MYQAILDHPRRREFDLSGLRTCNLYPWPRWAGRCWSAPIADLCPNFVLSSRPDRDVSGDHDVAPEVQLQRFGNYWGESLVVNETAIMDDAGNLLPRGQAGRTPCIAGPT